MLAAANASAAQAERIVDLAEKLEAEDQADDHTTDTDIEFHLAIAEASGNELFHQIVISFVPLMKVAIPQAWRTRQTSDQRRDSVDRHRKLAQAIRGRDVEGARHWMSAHFDETVGIMLRGNN
jgi:GntR family transcriptional repressor for pyruvate dehydrogenase complex